MLLLTAVLLWLSLRGLKTGEGENKSDLIWNAWRNADKTFLLLMALTAFVSHLMRAERWRILLQATGNRILLRNSFLSLMVGYLVNLAIPRGGEVSRCYNLYKLENTPVEVSFGTVVVERLVDLLCLVLLIAVSFFVEWDRLLTFIQTLNIPAITGTSIVVWALIGLAVLDLMVIAVILLSRNEKIKKIFLGFKEGLLSIARLKNKSLFIFYSLGIWALYFLMSYFVIMAFDETRDLGMSAVMTLFAIGSIAMAVPLPGGTGSYHTLVPLGLVMLYGLPEADAIAFVFIFHGWQTIIMIVGGVVSLVISYWIIRWKKARVK